MGFVEKALDMDSIKGTFDLYGIGDGKTLFDDYEPASASANAFAKAADPAARVGEYWKPAATVPDVAMMDNFRDMVFGKDRS